MSSNMLDTLLGSPTALYTTLLVCLLPVIAVLGLALSQHDAPPSPPAGCYKLGITGRSNLEDQYSKRYARGGDRTPSNPWTVKAMFIYPLKSCAPVELDNSEVLRTGLKYDRQFTLGQYVTSLPSMEGEVVSEWQFMTLRKFPRLAKVVTEMWVPDPSAPGYSEEGKWVKSEGCIVVRFPFSPDSDFSLEGLKNWGKVIAAKLTRGGEPMLEFKVPFNPSPEYIKSNGIKSQVLRIWKDTPEALDFASEVEPEMLAKLKYTLGTSNPVTLFRIDNQKPRQVKKNAPKKEDVGFETVIGMQDSYPFTIMNLASVHDVASNMPRRPQPMHLQFPTLNALRFRANIYITGPPAFHEDDWTKARITAPDTSSSLDLHISCRSTRCKLPNVDPLTGKLDRNEPNSTLRKYRIIDEGSKAACLGMMVTPLEDGDISVGDHVEVLETGKHFFLGGEGRKVEG